MLTQDFEVIPAIDVLQGRVVRLSQGRREAVTLEGGDPVELARRFRDEGARRSTSSTSTAHSAAPPHWASSTAWQQQGASPFRSAAGIEPSGAIAAAIAAGADRVMVGTAALSPEFLGEAAWRFGEQLVVAIDVRNGKVAVDGWTRTSEHHAGVTGR